MGLLFGRRVIVQLGTESSTGREFTDLRIAFSAKLTDGSKPNEAKIELYNPAPESVALAQQPNAIVRLLTGYESSGGAPRLVFQGNPVKDGVRLDRRNVDRVLTIQAQDGGRQYSAAHISESFANPTTSGAMFSTLADALGLPLGTVDDVVGSVAFPHGLALVGPVRDQLDRVAEMSGARWSIRDRTLCIWADGSTTGEQAIVFSAETGNLIGSPVVKDKSVEVTALLAPSLRPGKPFRVQSADTNGDYICTECTFVGDSGWAKDFYVKATGKPRAAA